MKKLINKLYFKSKSANHTREHFEPLLGVKLTNDFLFLFKTVCVCVDYNLIVSRISTRCLNYLSRQRRQRKIFNLDNYFPLLTSLSIQRCLNNTAKPRAPESLSDQSFKTFKRSYQFSTFWNLSKSIPTCFKWKKVDVVKNNIHWIYNTSNINLRSGMQHFEELSSQRVWHHRHKSKTNQISQSSNMKPSVRFSCKLRKELMSVSQRWLEPWDRYPWSLKPSFKNTCKYLLWHCRTKLEQHTLHPNTGTGQLLHASWRRLGKVNNQGLDLQGSKRLLYFLLLWNRHRLELGLADEGLS